MKGKFYIFTIFVSLLITGIGFYQLVEYHTRDRTPSSPPIPDTLGKPVVLKSTDLVTISAAGRLGNLVGDTIQVEADVVRRTGPDTFETKTMAGTTICKYKATEAPEAEGLKEGDRLIVTGRVYGYVANQLFLKACRFAPRTTALDDGWEIVRPKP